jgi:AraC-like DNA-binding protein
VRRAIAARYDLAFAETPDALLTLVADGGVRLVIVECLDGAAESMASVVSTLRDAYPLTAILAYASLSATYITEVLVMARAGVNGFVLRGIDDEPESLRRTLCGAQDENVARYVLGRLGPLIPPLARPIVAHCLMQARHRRSVSEIASDLGMDRKILGERLLRSFMPPPREVIHWCRLALAAYLLGESRASVSQVAGETGFPSTASLRELLRKYSGTRPGLLRTDSGLDYIVDRFALALAGQRAAR